MTRTAASYRSATTRSGVSLLAATRPLGRAALSCGLAGALSLGAAGAALASGHDGAPRGGAGQGQVAHGQKSSANAHRASQGRQPGADKGASSHQPAAAAKSTGSQQAAGPHGQGASGARQSSPQRAKDPRGNNGTIKIDGQAWDARVDNEPHTSCAFRVTFFGFDEGQTADITVTGIAPTGGGVLLHETAVPTSDDRAGGAAHDADGATRVYTADDLGLDSVTPHPKQGYHLKVTVDSREAPGGAKQKVLWLEPCGTQAPVTEKPVTEKPVTEKPVTQPGAGAPGTSESPAGPEVPGLAAGAELSRDTVAVAPPALRAEAAYLETAAAPAGRVSSQAADRPVQQASALPTSLAFTGASGLELLALGGAAAAAAGAGLLVLRRRTGAQAG
jgi:hypothetical protein